MVLAFLTLLINALVLNTMLADNVTPVVTPAPALTQPPAQTPAPALTQPPAIVTTPQPAASAAPAAAVPFTGSPTDF